jgi:hypothetical protein
MRFFCSNRSLYKFERCRATPVKVAGEWVMKEVEVVPADHVKTVVADDEEHMMELINGITSAGTFFSGCPQNRRALIVPRNNFLVDMDGYGVRPLWSIIRIENRGAGVSGIMIRVHHVIGDGIALVEALRNMFQDENGNTLVVDLPERVRGERGEGLLAMCWKFVTATVEVLALAQTAFDTDISFNAPNKKQLSNPAGRHKSIIFRTLRLEFVKELKNKAKCSINDVYMCALSGAHSQILRNKEGQRGYQ